MYRGQLPANARPLARIDAALPDGDHARITRFSASRKRAVRTQWVVHTRYRNGKRTVRLAQQYTGDKIALIDAEWDEAVDILRQAGAQVTITGASAPEATPA